jgi:hypothetical protein
LVEDPKTLDDRRAIARQFARDEDVAVPMLVDTMDDAVANAYAALPDRVFVVGRNGGFSYVGGVGPAGFHPEEIEPLLQRLPPM